jgi:serine O-acetyltransferase
MLAMLSHDLRRKARWMYGSDRWPAILKVLATSGTLAMILYRLMQWSRRNRLVPLEMVFNKLNAVCCNCIIGRGAEFGPGLIVLYGTGVVINGRVRGGSNVTIYQQVTLGGEQDRVPVLGDDVTIAAGAKVVGPVRIGDGSTVAVNSAVFRNVPPGTTVLGVPAQPVWIDEPCAAPPNGHVNGRDPATLVSPAPARPGVPYPAAASCDARGTGLGARLARCFAAVFGELSPEEIPQASISSMPEWDSMASMTLVALIEEEFELRIDAPEIARLTSFAQIMNYLEIRSCDHLCHDLVVDDRRRGRAQ